MSGVGAALAQVAPTGVRWWDVMLSVALGGVVPLAASASARWTWLMLAGVATGLSTLSVWFVVAAVAFALALWAAIGEWRDSLVGAVIGALAIQAVLRWPQVGFFGFDSIVATALVVPVLFTGYRSARRRTRRRVRTTAKVLGGAAAVLALLAAAVVLVGRGPAQAGVSAARAGLSAARGGDAEATVRDLQNAERAFIEADGAFNAIWAAPTRLIPIVGQHVAVLGAASNEGRKLSAAAASAVSTADIDRVTLSGGSVDVGLLAQMAPQLDELAATTAGARENVAAARSPWLVGAVDDRLDSLVQELDRAAPEAELAAQAAAVVPGLLGDDGPKRYMVIFGSPSESRELGGFMGSFALIEAAAGRLRKVTSGRPGVLYDIARTGALDDPAGYPPVFVEQDPVMWPQNLTGLPQIADVARATRDVFPELEGAPIDGVMYLDPWAVAGMLELTGPIQVEGVGFALDSTNVVSFLTRDQYALFPSVDDRFDFLGRTLDATFEALTTSSLPGPERLGAVFGPVAREGRLQMATFDDAANEFLRSTFLLQSYPEAGTTDFLSVVASNGTQNKLDSYVQRSTTYRIVTDPATGDHSGEVIVDLTLDVPPDVPNYVLGPLEFRGGLTRGDHQILLSIYTPHEVIFAGVDNEPVIFGATIDSGFNRYQVPVVLSVNGRTSATVRFAFEGTLAPADDYSLLLANQPAVNRDVVLVEMTHAPTGETAATRVILDQDLEIDWTPGEG